jgi:antitoxin MazE
MKVRIQHLEDALLVEVPMAIALETGLQAGSEIEIVLRGRQIVLIPTHERKYTLDELIDSMTQNKRHNELDFGPDVGNEIVE